MNEKIYEKIRRGDCLSDEELDEALRFFEILCASLKILRPRYDLALSDALQTLNQLQAYKFFRAPY